MREDKAEREAQRLARAEGRSYLAWRVPREGWRVEPRMDGEAQARADKPKALILVGHLGHIWHVTTETLDAPVWARGEAT
jgi:hypothetical protein